jgi:hypothetical protein
VRLSREPWVWLFSDDDLAHPDCVASFLDSLSASRPTFDLYRFPLGVIDQEGRILSDVRSFGETQSAGAFVLAKLREEIKSFAVEYVFSRSAFEREGGFIDFPAGWCADDASWCAIAGQRGIRSIESGGVFWRKSAVNISAPHSPFRRAKTLASIGYLEWLDARLNHHRDLLSEISEREIRGEFRHWFYGQLYSANPFLGPLTAIRVARRLASLTGEGLSSELYGVFRNEARALVRRTRKTVQPDDRTQ